MTLAVGATAMYNESTVDEYDERDLASARTGDEAAYARLVRRHQPAVAALLWRFTRDPAELDDLVQTVFVEAYFGLGRYRGAAPLAHWLARIATRAGYRFWKKRSRREAPASLDGIDPAAATDDADPAAAGRLAHDLLSRLPAPERLVLTLMYLEECSVRQIAERMGWTRPMVKMRAYRARRRLKAIATSERLLEKLGWTS